ncbi:uncharacterized protein METZ01_LOCUS509228, partial [marine metagenome]
TVLAILPDTFNLLLETPNILRLQHRITRFNTPTLQLTF